ncbi:hypothetical protein JTB14_001177 [Gonioctena quinquepunctata]|nr:hypothetical protein JTB14_001177 [Gonioctena quinquepunctata]
MITSTKAIFVENGKLKTPVAVVGLQFNHREMYEIYNEITTKCGEKKCAITCKHKELDCYILDNNAYVVLSDEPEYIGRYIGDIRPDILKDLVEDGVYIVTRMFDYQAICQKEPPEPVPETERVLNRKKKAEKAARAAAKKAAAKSAAGTKSGTSSRISMVLEHLSALSSWFLNTILFFARLVVSDDARYISNKPDMIAFNKLEIVKTVPTPCDEEMYLFNLNKTKRFPSSQFRKGIMKFDCSWPYVIDKIPNTNLLFLAANNNERDACKDRSSKTKHYSTEPREITYWTSTFENISFPCYIATMNNFTRRMYMDCYKRHHDEDKLNYLSRFYCGHTWY